jgi:hypothetical protein
LATRPTFSQTTSSDASKQLPTIKVRTGLVLVPTIVTDRSGAHGPGLKQEDFTLLQNGKPQQISFFCACENAGGAKQQLNEGIRTRLTLDALRQVGEAFTGIPGRKSLIWATGGFPFDVNDLERFEIDDQTLSSQHAEYDYGGLERSLLPYYEGALWTATTSWTDVAERHIGFSFRISAEGAKVDEQDTGSISLLPGEYRVTFGVRDNLSGLIGTVSAPLVVH